MFIITKDLIDNGKYVGVCTNSNPKWLPKFDGKFDAKTIASIRRKMPYRFRLLDGDGEVYYEGYSSSNDDENAFNPLDEFGVGAGCTEIQYWNAGKDGGWKQL